MTTIKSTVKAWLSPNRDYDFDNIQVEDLVFSNIDMDKYSNYIYYGLATIEVDIELGRSKVIQNKILALETKIAEETLEADKRMKPLQDQLEAMKILAKWENTLNEVDEERKAGAEWINVKFT